MWEDFNSPFSVLISIMTIRRCHVTPRINSHVMDISYSVSEGNDKEIYWIDGNFKDTNDLGFDEVEHYFVTDLETYCWADLNETIISGYGPYMSRMDQRLIREAVEQFKSTTDRRR